MSPKGRALGGLIVGVVGLVAAAAMGIAYATKSTGTQATSQGFVVEPADSIGPDAFTPSVVTGDAPSCDKAALVQDLQARPDAIGQWARVLSLTTAQVPAYVQSLQPMVLQADTEVTNHGLHNGQAYARQSLLSSGTVVLVDTHFPTGATTPMVPGGTSTSSPSPSTTVPPPSTTLASPSTTVPATATPTPVTRCKCGNPLLPPYTLTPPALTTPSTTTTKPSTTTTKPSTTSTKPSTTSTTKPTSPTTKPTSPTTQPTSPTTQTPPSSPAHMMPASRAPP